MQRLAGKAGRWAGVRGLMCAAWPHRIPSGHAGFTRPASKAPRAWRLHPAPINRVALLMQNSILPALNQHAVCSGGKLSTRLSYAGSSLHDFLRRRPCSGPLGRRGGGACCPRGPARWRERPSAVAARQSRHARLATRCAALSSRCPWRQSRCLQRRDLIRYFKMTKAKARISSDGRVL